MFRFLATLALFAAGLFNMESVSADSSRISASIRCGDFMEPTWKNGLRDPSVKVDELTVCVKGEMKLQKLSITASY